MKIGFIIADEKEFSPVEAKCKELNGKSFFLYGDKIVSFSIDVDKEIYAILCGTGKVNAAAATANLICSYAPDVVINFGLSGALKDEFNNSVVVGTSLVEHDFDLTPLGYKIGIKPQEKSIYEPDSLLMQKLLRKNPYIKTCTLVCGDSFISSTDKKNMLINEFDAGACDMESCAIASICYKAKIPFLSIRGISDSADESATDDYTKENDKENDNLLNIALSIF